MGTPTFWMRAREMWLEETGKAHEFNRRALELVKDRTSFDERQEMLDDEFGITYDLLKPYIDRYEQQQREKKAAKAAGKAAAKQARQSEDDGGAEPDRGDPLPAPAEGGAGGDHPETIGGDLSDVRWALANLSRSGVNPKDAPSAIAWNLLVIGRGGTQGQLKLLDIYRATIVQPAAKAAESGPVEGPDVRLDELLARLGDGLAGDT